VNGFVLPVHKEEDWTSHDAVHRLRRLLGVQEIGHAGSLDPFATGVLLCGVGRGTKILSYLMDLPKEYVGVMRLGVTTDSGDMTGQVIEEKPVEAIDPERARELTRRFIGRTQQIPPMVSAIKQQGKRLYELARKGIEVERKPRTIEIHAFDLLKLEGDRIEFRVLCAKGTYIRSLAQDFGRELGPGASLEQLKRSAVGPFDESTTVSLLGEPLEARARALAGAIPLATALSHLSALRLRPDWVRRVRQGGQPPWRAVEAADLPSTERIRLLGSEGELIAIASLDAVPGIPERSWRDSWELRLDRVL
jgi:tRNA pseudouridine55 synthase